MTPPIGSILPPPPPAIPHPSTVVPYLFGGLAAMLALIALALLILACSYLRHTANIQIQMDLEAGAGAGGKLEKSGNPASALKETILVIMAGDAKPSFLGTAMSGSECCCGEKSEKVENEKEDENEKEEDVN